MTIPDKKIAQLQRITRRLRLHILRMVGVGKPGHIGGSCSSADIVATAKDVLAQA
jgi:transketolase N-terminal domain/subunit